MAQPEKIVFEVEIDGKKAEKSLGGLETRIEKLKKLREGEQIGSKAFQDLSRDIQKAESAVKDIELEFEALDFEQKLTAGSDAVVGLAGGFAAAEGAAALFGAESEALEETLTKVAGALALSQGLRDLANGAIALRKLNVVKKVNIALENLQAAAEKRRAASTVASTGVTGVATAAQWLWNAALYANPVVAIAVAIAALIAIIYGLVSVLSDSSKEFDKAAAKQEAFNDAVKEANKNTVEQKTQLRTLVDVARDETASLEARQQALKELNDISPEYFGNLTLENIATEEGTKLLNDFVRALNDKAETEAINSKLVEEHKKLIEAETKSIGQGINPINAVKDLWGMITENKTILEVVNERLVKQRNEETKGIRDQISALEELAKEQEIERLENSKAAAEAKKLLDEKEKAAQKAEKDEEARSKTRKQARAAEAKRQQKLRDEEAKSFADLILKIEKLENEAEDKKLSKEQREINAIQDKFFKTIELAKQNNLDVQSLEIAQQEAIAEIRKRFRDEETARLEEQRLIDEEARLAEVQRLDDAAQSELDAEEAAEEAAEAKRAKDVQDDLDARNKKLDTYQSGLDALTAANELFQSKELKALREKQKRGEQLTKAELNMLGRAEKRKKDLAIAQIAIDTARGISAAVAAGAGVPFPANIPAILAGVGAVIAGVVKAKAILGSADSGISAESITSAATGTEGAQLNNISNTASLVDQDQQNLSQPVLVVETFNEVNGNVTEVEEAASF